MSQTQHPNYQEELMTYADGQLQGDEAKRIAAHIETCSDCAQAVADAKDLSNQLGNWKIEEAPAALTDSVLAVLESRTRRASTQPGSAWWKPSRMVAYGLGGVFVTGFLLVFVVAPSLLRSRQAAPISAALMHPPATATVPEPGESLGRLELERVQSDKSPEPMVIRTMRLAIITKSFDSSRERIETIVKNSKGYVDQLTVRNTPGSARSLSAMLRFPSNSLDAGLGELRKLGQVKEESQNSSDVTAQYVDLQARLNNARNTEQRMIVILRDRTGNIKDVVEAERELSRVREEIERMEAERKNLSNKVDYASVQVVVEEEYHAQVQPASPSARTRVRNAAIDGFENGKESALGILLFILANGPSLFVGLMIIMPIAFVALRLLDRFNARHQRV